MFYAVAWDIETTGLDPVAASTTHVSFYGQTPACEIARVFSVAQIGTEAVFLSQIDDFVATLDAELLTWNGSGFDIRFVASRATVLGVPIALDTFVIPDAFAKYPDEEGNPIPLLDATWHSLPHRDIAYEYQQECVEAGDRWGLKPTARRHGIEVIELDRANMARYTDAEITDYALSDAVATYRLAEIRAATS